MTASPIRLVVWDWNGTLLDDTWLCIDIMNGMLARRGLPVMSHARYQEAFDFPVIRYYERVGYDFAKESFEKLGTEFIDEYERRRGEPVLTTGALDTLAALGRAGVEHAILSGYRHTTLEQLLVHHGIRKLFTDVIGADDHYASGKVERGRRWIAQHRVRPEHVVMVGDTIHDFETAHAMGAHCILMTTGSHARARLETCGVPVLDTQDELCRALLAETAPSR